MKPLACLLLLACGPVDVVVADVPKQCTLSSECRPGDVCDRHECGDDYGICRPPATCSGTALPECGCDGHRYDSPCAREAAGVSRGPGPC